MSISPHRQSQPWIILVLLSQGRPYLLLSDFFPYSSDYKNDLHMLTPYSFVTYMSSRLNSRSIISISVNSSLSGRGRKFLAILTYSYSEYVPHLDSAIGAFQLKIFVISCLMLTHPIIISYELYQNILITSAEVLFLIPQTGSVSPSSGGRISSWIQFLNQWHIF